MKFAVLAAFALALDASNWKLPFPKTGLLIANVDASALPAGQQVHVCIGAQDCSINSDWRKTKDKESGQLSRSILRIPG